MAISSSCSKLKGQTQKSSILKLEVKDDISPAPYAGNGAITNLESKSHPSHIASSSLHTSSFVTSPASGSQHLPQSALLLPPYTANIKGGGTQGTEAITLNSYLKLMSLVSNQCICN